MSQRQTRSQDRIQEKDKGKTKRGKSRDDKEHADQTTLDKHLVTTKQTGGERSRGTVTTKKKTVQAKMPAPPKKKKKTVPKEKTDKTTKTTPMSGKTGTTTPKQSESSGGGGDDDDDDEFDESTYIALHNKWIRWEEKSVDIEIDIIYRGGARKLADGGIISLWRFICSESKLYG